MAGAFSSPPFPSVGFDFASSGQALPAQASSPPQGPHASQPFPSSSFGMELASSALPVFSFSPGGPGDVSSFLPALAPTGGPDPASLLASSSLGSVGAAPASPAFFSAAGSALPADASLFASQKPLFPSASPSSSQQRLVLTPQEVETYMHLWRTAGGFGPDASSPVLEGSVAAAFLESSGLDRALLHEIWRLADAKNTGNLDVESFACACRLVAHAQNGMPVSAEAISVEPAALPHFARASPQTSTLPSTASGVNPEAGSLAAVSDLSLGVGPAGVDGGAGPENAALFGSTLTGSVSSPTSGDRSDALYVGTPEEYRRYAQVFADTDGNHDGYVEGGDARNVFTSSLLPDTDLAAIWALADVDCDGRLTLKEFLLAMTLIGKRKKGGLPIPATLPAALFQSVQAFQVSGGAGVEGGAGAFFGDTGALGPSGLAPPAVAGGLGAGFLEPTAPALLDGPAGDGGGSWGSFGLEGQPGGFDKEGEGLGAMSLSPREQETVSKREKKKGSSSRGGSRSRQARDSEEERGQKKAESGDEETSLSFGDRVSAAKEKRSEGEGVAGRGKKEKKKSRRSEEAIVDRGKGDSDSEQRALPSPADLREERRKRKDEETLEEKWLARRRERVSSKRAAAGAGLPEESEEERTLALLESVVETDKRLSDILRADVDGDAEEIEEVRELRILLEAELLAEKKELARQIDRKRDFALQLEDEKVKLEQLKEERKKIEFERIGIERDLSHYVEELLFLRGQVDDMQRDIDALHQANQTLVATHRHQQIQAQNLHATRLQAQEQLRGEREALQKEEREIAELKALLSRMRREKSEAQSRNAVLHERLRQADQDKSVQFASLDAARLQAAAVRDERMQILQQKQQIVSDLNQLAQQTVLGLQRPSARTALAGSAPVEGRAAPVRRDAKGVPAGAAPANASLVLTSSRPIESSSPSHWTLFSSVPARPASTFASSGGPLALPLQGVRDPEAERRGVSSFSEYKLREATESGRLPHATPFSAAHAVASDGSATNAAGLDAYGEAPFYGVLKPRGLHAGGRREASALARDLETRGVEGILGIESVKSDGDRSYSRHTSGELDRRRHTDLHWSSVGHSRAGAGVSRRGLSEAGAHDERRRSPGSFGSEGGSHAGAFLSYEGSRMQEERTGSGHDRRLESSGSPDRSEKKEKKRSDEKKTRGSSSGRHGKSKKKNEELLQRNAVDDGSFGADCRSSSDEKKEFQRQDERGRKEFGNESFGGDDPILSGLDTPSFGARPVTGLRGLAAASL
ncbi:UNVERIFIED_CONTAM: EF hand domain-containing protein [Hammondia hammondi]|eukprot:XP_008882123.1 EF hand domain-containing protein [Hammondia hammondi]